MFRSEVDACGFERNFDCVDQAFGYLAFLHLKISYRVETNISHVGETLLRYCEKGAGGAALCGGHMDISIGGILIAVICLFYQDLGTLITDDFLCNVLKVGRNSFDTEAKEDGYRNKVIIIQ
jgi:hypothetical protein